MKWYVTTSVIAGGLNAVLASIELSLAAFHLFTNKSTNAPIAQNGEWIALVKNLVAFTGVWMAIAIVGIFVSMTKKSQIALPTVVLLLYCLCLGGSIYFTITFGKQLNLKDVLPETLFKKTLRQINAQGSQTWIPTWLDNIQKQSKQCCGVITYHDYEDFWPNTPTKIPRSCCRDRKNPVDPCPSDLTKIPYPDTPDIYFKVETGCMDEINEATRRNIRESFYHSMTMSIVIGIGLLVLLMAYVQQFLNKDKDKSKNTTGGEQGAGDAVVPVSSQSNNFISDSEALMIDSNGQMIASIESIAPLATYESMPQQVPQFQQQPVQAPLQQPQPTQSSSIPPQSSNARFNKVNAVFAGLQQTSGKFPEASTGDDMTVGGSNIGRREVFVAQDNKPSQQIPPTQSNQQQQPQQQNSKGERGNFASSSSGDEFADDVIRDDQDPGGQASGRKKKGRKHKRRNSSDYGNDS